VAVVGVCGALDPGLQPGDVVVATELRSADGRVQLDVPSAALVAADLARAGLPVRTGPLVTGHGLVTGAARERLRDQGVLAVDMESAWIAAEVGAASRPFSVVRVVLDTPQRELRSIGTVTNLPLVRRRIAAAMPTLERWARAAAPRQVVLASPRSFCAGVERAIEIVERALDRFGPPVYVRRQIVHNTHVVRDLEDRGAVFVREVDEVPAGSVVVLAAHGVSPDVRRDADERALTVVDATCPLVAKVHAEAKRFAGRDFDVVLIGHAAHEEVEGTVGEAPGRITVVSTPEQVDALQVRDPQKVAYLTQTTLAVDETEVIVGHLRRRFPSLAGPRTEDICYATQNRQEAVAAVAAEVDLVLVVGSANSSNSARLAEVAARCGTAAHLIDAPGEISLEWLPGVRRVGVTAGASAPESKVQAVVDALRGLGTVRVDERVTRIETMSFPLPVEVRP
jgi:4-hydroxy-3-methylbut-2-enyl diphosphate reductase